MPSIPQQANDIFTLASQVVAGGSNSIPGYSSPDTLPLTGDFSSGPPPNRTAVITRNLAQFFIPEVGVVEMYINPQSISYQNKKHITSQRTKGGYVLQYWGEELTQINIQGTTGSSGIEGINVLENVYRSEQLSFDPYALALQANRDAQDNDQFSFLGDFPSGSLGSTITGSSFNTLINSSIQTGAVTATRDSPTLASLAFQLTFYFCGWQFRGYFQDFKVEESASKIGLFDYSMTFIATQRSGTRYNAFGWQRSANGPSGSTPYSYSSLYQDNPQPSKTIAQVTQPINSLDFISSIF